MANSNLSEQKLAAELAVAVSQFMQSELPGNADEHGFVSHEFQGPFDENCYVLWELGVALAASPSGDQGITFHEWPKTEPNDVGPGAFKFMPPDKIHATMTAHGEIAPALLFRLLETYLRSMGDYSWRRAQLDVGRESFVPEPIFEPQIHALVECGYLVRSGRSVRWTDHIGPVMRSAGHWDEVSEQSPRGATALSSADRERIERMIRSGQRIEAVAAIRDVANVGLAEAKWLMEQMDRAMANK
jgi:hypothetical protein